MHLNSLIYVIFQLKCGNCGEVSEKWQYLRLMVSFPVVTCIKQRKQACLVHAVNRNISVRQMHIK